MGKIRVGIIGTGFGTVVQAPGFQLHPEYEVVALGGVHRPGRAAEQAARLGIARAYDNYLEMLDQENLDLVSVASAPNLHHPMTLAALERRIPVLCEKPTAMNLAEAEAMLDAAERRGLVHAIDHEFRFVPERFRFHQLATEGFLGELVHFTITMWVSGFQRQAPRPYGWLQDAAQGGGFLGALGSHMIDQIRWCFGAIDSVSGKLTTHVTEREGHPVTADDTFSFLCKMAGGNATGCFNLISQAQHGFGIRLEAYGTEGTAVMSPGRLQAARVGEPLADLALPASPDVPGVTFRAGLDHRIPPFTALADRLARALRGETPADLPTFRDGVAVQAVMDAVRQSDAEGRWIRVPKHA